MTPPKAPRPTRSRPAPSAAPQDESASQDTAVPAVPTIPLPFPVNRYRVMFSDGDVIDFLSYSDHSGIREAMLDAHYGPRVGKTARAQGDQDKRIEGIAHLGQEYIHTPASP